MPEQRKPTREEALRAAAKIIAREIVRLERERVVREGLTVRDKSAALPMEP